MHSVRELGAKAGMEAVAQARAADFAVLRRESERATSELTKWLGLSDTEFHSMTPSQLRGAMERWIERAESSPEVAEQAQAHAGTLIGDDVRRAVEADKRSGRYLAGGDNVSAAQAIPGDLVGRLHDWVGEDAEIVRRWTDVHATTDRMLATPNLVLRLGADESHASAEAVHTAHALHERDSRKPRAPWARP